MSSGGEGGESGGESGIGEIVVRRAAAGGELGCGRQKKLRRSAACWICNREKLFPAVRDGEGFDGVGVDAELRRDHVADVTDSGIEGIAEVGETRDANSVNLSGWNVSLG